MSFTFVGPIPVPKPQSTPLNVLITGASRGLGFEMVRQYATAHPENIVFAAVRDPSGSSASAVAAYAKEHSNVHVVKLDVSEESTIVKSVSAVSKVVDRLDLLVNNAGVFGEAESTDVTKVTASQFNSVLNTNVTGPLITTQQYLPLLLKSSNAKVVMVSSAIGSNPMANIFGKPVTAYGVSKAGLNYLTSVFKYAVPSVTFLSISPGWVDTDMGSAQAKAPVTAQESVQALRHYIDEKTNANSGEFFDIMSGQIIPF